MVIVQKDAILKSLNSEFTPKYTAADIHPGMPYDGWSGIAVIQSWQGYRYVFADCFGGRVCQRCVSNGAFDNRLVLMDTDRVVAYIKRVNKAMEE